MTSVEQSGEKGSNCSKNEVRWERFVSCLKLTFFKCTDESQTSWPVLSDEFKYMEGLEMLQSTKRILELKHTEIL